MPETSEVAAAPAEVKTPSPTAETAEKTEPAAAVETTNGHSEEPATTNGDGSEKSSDEKKEDPPKEMRAVVLTGFGGFKGVKILKKPEPVLQAGEVLIRVKAW
jgi:hypothetical protein